MHKFHKRSKRTLIFGFAFGLFILLASSAVSYLSIRQLLDSQQWVEHTTQVKLALENLISQMKDAETGQRGFLLTGQDTFLEPYNGSKAKVSEYLSQVEFLTKDNASQQHDLPFLEKLLHEKFTIIDQTIADKRRGIPPVTSTLLRGKSIMDSVRSFVSVMSVREDKLMVIRNARMDKFVAYTPIFIWIASLIGMVIAVVFYLKVNKDSKIAEQLEQELIHKNKSTEKQIEAISGVAKKIADGDYDVRIEAKDLE